MGSRVNQLAGLGDGRPRMENLDSYNKVHGYLQEAKIVKVSNHFVTLTEKGLAMLDKIEALFPLPVKEEEKEWQGVYPAECKGMTHCPRKLSCCE